MGASRAPGAAGHDAAVRLCRTRWRVRLAALLITAAVVAVYANSLPGVFVLDDLHTIVHNPALDNPLSAAALFGAPRGSPAAGRPLVAGSLALNHALSGLAPAGYHVVNVAIHVLAALLLFGFARRTLLLAGMPRALQRAALPLAACITLLWALHPLHTSCVTYISQRAETLCGALALATFYASARGLAPHASVRWRALAILACALGMAAKENMAVVPLLVLLYDRIYCSGTPLAERRRFHAGLFATLLVLLLLNLSAPRGASISWSGDGLNAWTYLLSQSRAITGYLVTAAAPTSLVFDHGTAYASSLAEVWPQATVVVMLLIAVGTGLKRAPRAAWPGVAFFFVLAPSSSIVPIASEIAADHRMYLPLASLVALLVCCGWLALTRLTAGARWPAFAAAAMVLGVAAWFAMLTVERNRVFHEAATLWRDVVVKRPYNHRAWTYLGNALLAADRPRDAAAAYAQSLAIVPGNVDALANLALARMATGDLADAVRLAERAAAGIDADTPSASRFAMAHNLGIALARAGRAGAALPWFERALAVEPINRDAMMNRGKALLDIAAVTSPPQRNAYLDAAAAQFAAVAARYARLAEAHAKLAQALFARLAVPAAGALDRTTHTALVEVVQHLERALRLAPGNAEYARNLAVVRARLSADR